MSLFGPRSIASLRPSSAERFRVTGKVDAAWLEKTLDDLAKADPGPE